MDRREALKNLGVGAGVAVAAPVGASEDVVAEYSDFGSAYFAPSVAYGSWTDTAAA